VTVDGPLLAVAARVTFGSVFQNNEVGVGLEST